MKLPHIYWRRREISMVPFWLCLRYRVLKCWMWHFCHALGQHGVLCWGLGQSLFLFVSHYNAWKHLPSVKNQYVELSADHQFSVFFWLVVKAVFKHLVDNRYWNLFLWVKNNVSVSLFLSMFRKMYTILVILGNKIRASLSNQAFLKTLPSRFCKFTVLSSLFLSAIAEQVADAYTRWWK